MKYLYHGSSVPDLEVLQPHTSLHSDSYVYAVTNRFDALWYCTDFKGFHEIADEEGCIDFIKVENIYKGKQGYIYYLNPKDFIYHNEIDHWVVENPVKILFSEHIEDVFAELKKVYGNRKIYIEQVKY